MMRLLKKFILAIFVAILLSPVSSFAQGQKQPLLIRVFHLPHCKACIKTISDIIPPIAQKYGDRLQWNYIDISNEYNYKIFLDLQRKTGRTLGSPTILIGKNVLVGLYEISDSLEKTINQELVSRHEAIPLEGGAINLLERFKSFGPLTVIGAGLEDGINPCAFTVIVFFISFLTVMGYKRKEMALIGAGYILAVFLTYLAMGFGIFKVLYSLKIFFLISRITYLVIGGLSLFFGYLALRDYFIYKKTGSTEELALQLPRPIKNKIHAIVGDYYRKDKSAQAKSFWGLFMSAVVVGFMVSLIEAVCTGQLYLPTIVFIFKQGSLRARALFYLIVYNVMFILPLVAILAMALRGVSSKQFEGFARKNLGFIKLAMAAVFLALGIFLLMEF